jgi:hypothetical protein
MGRRPRSGNSRTLKFKIVGRLCQTPILLVKAFDRMEPLGRERHRRHLAKARERERASQTPYKLFQRHRFVRLVAEFLEAQIVSE